MQQINIEKLIQTKNPKLLTWIPKFILNYIKKIIHQDEVNETLRITDGYDAFTFSKYVVDDFGVEVEFDGYENIPKTGGVIITMNHPLGGMDALSIITKIREIRNDFVFIVNDVLMNLESMKEVFVGVNKFGGNSKKSLEYLNEVYSSGQAIFVFPAGLVSRRKKGIVKDVEWKKTFVTRAKKLNLPVVPVHISGELSSFFYNLSNFRTFIGIKSNIEMLYLVNELYKQKGKKIKIRCGTIIESNIFDKSKTDLEWAQLVKDKVYEL